ncbi:hypothetical protein [Deinococcus apachensis]|uniref:hypothetical protein n=1 Tax=Deinococcus apachensis TaxID=309886 RepID=UPI00036967E8|nr:hypothetical protein [Deinococcus apachensis]
MTCARRFLLPALLIALPPGAASAATVPSNLVGEWFGGPQYAAAVYTTDLGKASSNSTRLLLNSDGSYVFTRFTSTQVASSFGFSGYPITCQTMDATVERGQVAVQGGRLTFKPSRVDRHLGYSPPNLNNGCKRYAATKKTSSGGDVETATWTAGSGVLTLKFGAEAVKFVRREPPPKPTPVDTGLDSTLRGEWHLGRVLSGEDYDPTKTLWTGADSTSAILKLNADFTYERTSLVVGREYGCNPKRLVIEKGRVSEKSRVLTFTPTASTTAKLGCGSRQTTTTRNGVKPYQEAYEVRIGVVGNSALILTANGENLYFARPTETPARSTTPAVSGPPASSASSPSSSRPTAKWTASGTWDAVVSVDGTTHRVRVTLDDDSPRIIGYGSGPVRFALGDSAAGTLSLGLEVGGREFEFRAQGRFDGDRYAGEGTWMRGGEVVGRGTLTMTRR